jgi:hypothetical protein
MSAFSRRRLALILAVVLTAAAVPHAQSGSSQATPHMVVLLFDLNASSEERERSVAMAQRAVVDAHLRFGLGFEVGRVWRIATIGSLVDIAQDFTGDWNKINAALSRIAGAPSTTSEVSRRIEAVQRFCAELSQLPTSDSYFSDAPQMAARRAVGTVAGPPDSRRRSLEYYLAGNGMTAEDHRRLEAECRQPNVVYRAVTETSSMAMLGGRLTAFVFDTATLSLDDLRQALERASKVVESLPDDHAIAVVTTGVAPRFMQDFTRNRRRVREAFAKVEVPDTSPDARTTVTSVRSLCGMMARGANMTQQFFVDRGVMVAYRPAPVIIGMPTGRLVLSLSPPQVFYFSTGVERGLVAGRELYDVAATCTNGGISFHVLDSPWISPVYAPPSASPAPGMRQIGYDVGIGLSLAARQQDCPVALATKQLELDSGYVSAIIRNESAKQVQRVTLGVVVTPNDDSLNVPRVLIMPGPGTALTPGQTFEMATRLAEFDVLALLSRQGARAELGVVEVQFGDGTKWTYDLKAKGRFERQ